MVCGNAGQAAFCAVWFVYLGSLVPSGAGSALCPQTLRRAWLRHVCRWSRDPDPGRPANQHTLEETKGYLRCTTCGQSIHKRTNEDAVQAYVQGPCINRLYDQAHTGHPSHLLWQKGDKLHCKHCGTQTNTDAQHRPIITATLTRSCKGAPIAASPPITEIFKRQHAQAAQATPQPTPSPTAPSIGATPSSAQLQTGHEPQPALEAKAETNTSGILSPLAPRQLIQCCAHTTALSTSCTTAARHLAG